MTNSKKIYLGIGLVLLYILIVGLVSIPYINAIESSAIVLAMLFAIVFMVSTGVLLAYLWKGVNLQENGNKRWLIFIIVFALFGYIVFVEAFWFLALGPLVMPFMGFWFARRFFDW